MNGDQREKLDEWVHQARETAEKTQASESPPTLKLWGRAIHLYSDRLYEAIRDGDAEGAAFYAWQVQQMRFYATLVIEDPDSVLEGAYPRYESDQDIAYSTRIGRKSRGGGAANRGKSKRRPWALRAAEYVTAWEELPEPSSAWEFEDMLVCVYRDGDMLCAADIDGLGGEPATLARSTFEKRYLKKK